MSAGHREDPYDGLLPERVEARLLGLGARSAGLLLLALTAFLWLSLLSWSVNDPSLTHQAGGNAGNAAGPAGAIFSDLLLQMLGFGAVAALLAPMLWGIDLVAAERVEHFRAKALFYPPSILLLAGAFATLPVAGGWPLHHAMGGILGDVVGEIARSLAGSVLGAKLGTLVAGGCLFAAGLSAAARSIGADLSAVRRAAEARLRPVSVPAGTWHQNLKAEAHRLSGQERVTPPAGRADVDDEDDSALESGSPGAQRHPVGQMWARLRSRFDEAGEQEADDDDAVEPSLTARPVEAGEQSIAARFAASFDRLDVLRPGSRDGDDPDTEAGMAQSLAARFTPFKTRRPDVRDADAPLPDPGAADPLAPVRGRRAAPKAAAQPSRPPLNILKKPMGGRTGAEVSLAAARVIGQQLLDVLADYGIKGEMRDIKPGPVVTLYEFEPVRGTKTARVIALADDIARSMSVTSVRVAVVPGRNTIGLELPNAKRDPVLLREMLESETFRTSKAILPMALGKSIGGDSIVTDLARMPHLLVAGTTGSGKSVGVNAMVLSLLYRHTPDECRFIMIDPKMLELSVYNGIPHLLTPVVTDPHKAVAALGWAVTEMEERYKRMASLSVRNVEAFNARVKAATERGEMLVRTVQTGFDRATGQPRYERIEIDTRPMPYIVIVVDEFADLMIVAGKEIEQAVQRLAQMARAAGLHLIMATQRPSVDIITGTIKANFPTRISFKVTSKIDSRTILNEQGAEQLLGQGDMLFSGGGGVATRVHGPFVSDEEVEAVASFLKSQGEPEYVAGVTDGADDGDLDSGLDGSRGGGEDDLYRRALALVLADRKASTSYLQRRLSIGYNRAADLIERMEREGHISAANSTGKREILKGAA